MPSNPKLLMLFVKGNYICDKVYNSDAERDRKKTVLTKLYALQRKEHYFKEIENKIENMSVIDELRKTSSKQPKKQSYFEEPPFIGIILRRGSFIMTKEGFNEQINYFIANGKSLRQYLADRNIFIDNISETNIKLFKPKNN
jgi:hypothetical protein